MGTDDTGLYVYMIVTDVCANYVIVKMADIVSLLVNTILEEFEQT